MTPFRGILIGLVISAVLWAAIRAGAVDVVLSIMEGVWLSMFPLEPTSDI